MEGLWESYRVTVLCMPVTDDNWTEPISKNKITVFTAGSHQQAVAAPVHGLFVPNTFRSQVPMGNFRSRDFLFPGNESSLSSLKPFVPGEQTSFHGTFVLRNFCSQDFSFPGTFVPLTILQSISYELQTAVTTVRICLVVGLVLFVFQK